MKSCLLLFIVLLCSTGCASKLTPGSLKGEWRFAYIIEGMVPPRFDRMVFVDDNHARLTSTLDDKTFETTYSLASERITLGPMDPDKRAPAQTLGARLGGLGTGLTLETQGNSLQFLRAELLLKDNLAGRWTSDGGMEPLNLTVDGKLLSDEQKVTGYYRLWRSKVGKALTLVIFEPEEGTFALSFAYKLRGDELELIPITALLESRSKQANLPLRLKRSGPVGTN